MPKPERPAVEQQALAAELLAEDAVVLALSVGRIARQVVADVFQVPPDLVPAPGFRGN